MSLFRRSPEVHGTLCQSMAWAVHAGARSFRHLGLASGETPSPAGLRCSSEGFSLLQPPITTVYSLFPEYVTPDILQPDN